MSAAGRRCRWPPPGSPALDVSLPGGAKIAGAAQARRRGAVLHHVTAAFATDPAVVPRLIRIGRPRRHDRGLRSAEREVTPLSMFTPLPLDAVVEALERAAGGPREAVSAEELEAARDLVRTKYGTAAWRDRLP